MKKILAFFRDGVFEEWVGRIAITVVIIPVVINIINRSFLNHYSVDLETIALFAYVWIGYGFFGYLYEKDAHVDVKFIVNGAGPVFRTVLEIVRELFVFAFSTYMVYWGAKLCKAGMNRTVPGTQISYVLGYASIVFGFLSGAIRSFCSLASRFFKNNKKEDMAE